MPINPIFADDIFSSKNNINYGGQPIPTQRDEQIRAILSNWSLLDEVSRRRASSEINGDKLMTLLAFSERMATLSVRARESEFVRLGLLALGLNGWNGDWRENIILLSLHVDALERIGVQPVKLFKPAGQLLSSPVRQAFSDFLRRTPEDQSIEAMGYIARGKGDDFSYSRTW